MCAGQKLINYLSNNHRIAAHGSGTQRYFYSFLRIYQRSQFLLYVTGQLSNLLATIQKRQTSARHMSAFHSKIKIKQVLAGPTIITSQHQLSFKP